MAATARAYGGSFMSEKSTQPNDKNNLVIDFVKTFISPLFISILFFYVNGIQSSMLLLKNDLCDEIRDIRLEVKDMRHDMLTHFQNDEIHTPKSIVLTRPEFTIYQEMRAQQMDGFAKKLLYIEEKMDKQYSISFDNNRLLKQMSTFKEKQQ
jgi:hypothetical protein